MPFLRPPFPESLDSTLVGSFRSCPQRFYLEYMEHWKPKSSNVHLHAGASFAKGLEIARKRFWIETAPKAIAIRAGQEALAEAYGDFQCPPDSTKSKDRMIGAYNYYMDRFDITATEPLALHQGLSRAIEVSFATPLPVENPETGSLVLYTGRADQLVNYAKGKFGEDDKTTSQLGASWARQWDLRSQFTGYVWGFGELGVHLDGFLIRGVSILKTKYDSAEAITYRPQWEVDRWLEQTVRDVQRMVQCWKDGFWDYNLDHACSEYGGCMFQQVCKMRDPSDLLPAYFERRRWDPLLRTETNLDEKGTS